MKNAVKAMAMRAMARIARRKPGFHDADSLLILILPWPE